MSLISNDVFALLSQHGKQLHALLFRVTLRADVAEDLLQELFCKLATSDGFQRAKNPTGYAYRAASNLAFDWHRARKRNPISNSDHSETPSADAAPLANMLRREELEQTLAAIDQLPTVSRDIVVPKYLQQQSYAEIATQFNKTEDQVRALAFKAIQQLRNILGVKRPQPQPISQTKEPI